MKRKSFLFALSTVVLSVAGYVGYQWVSNSIETDLFMANVEALSRGESTSIDGFECWGPAIYSDVEAAKGTMTGRVHVNDSTDMETIYDYERCSAKGDGGRMGANYVMVDPTESKYVKCTNNHIDVYF